MYKLFIFGIIIYIFGINDLSVNSSSELLMQLVINAFPNGEIISFKHMSGTTPKESNNIHISIPVR